MVGSRITTKHDCIILDACCVMNLYASRKMGEIISAIAETVAVAVYVMKVEALTVYQESKRAAPDDKEQIDLQPFIDNEVLIAAALESDAENAAFLEFATQRLDDGEAATMAIAVNRNWAVATDDRAARRISQNQYEHIQLVSTPELMRHWQDIKKPDPHILRHALLNTENRANYLVGRRHPLYEWWQSCKEV